MLMYIQIYNFKSVVSSVNARKNAAKQDMSGSVTHYFVVAQSFRRFRKVYGEKTRHILLSVPAITLTCPITTVLFVGHV